VSVSEVNISELYKFNDNSGKDAKEILVDIKCFFYFSDVRCKCLENKKPAGTESNPAGIRGSEVQIQIIL